MHVEMRSKYDEGAEVLPYLKREDMANVAIMFLYLSYHGLSSKIQGPILSGRQNYQEIVITAEGTRKDVNSTFMGITTGHELEELIAGAEWDMIYPTMGLPGQEKDYGLDIDHRLKIKAGKTLIDLCMKYKPK